ALTEQPRQRNTAAKTIAPETAAKKAKIVAPPPDESAELAKASGVADATERIAALRKFLETFPASEKKDQVVELIVRARAELGVQRQQAGDMEAAAAIFLAVANETPKPIPAQLFADIISKMPANLFFHEQREKGLEIARVIEEKADTNADQLLSLA